MKRRDLFKTGLAAAAGLGWGTSASAASADTATPTPSIKDWSTNGRWTIERANAWYAKQPWIVGCNYVPSTAVNQLETWQAETFDPKTIDRELGYAESLGMNTARIFLHDLAWKNDAKGFKERLARFLEIATKHKIRALITFFTNGGPGTEIKAGKQPEPDLRTHNSRWLQSPGKAVATDPSSWSYLEDYVKDVVTTFAKDERILLWCLYNEPENTGKGYSSMPLIQHLWKWARQVAPSHPLTGSYVPDWYGNDIPVASFLGENSDVISFQVYKNAKETKKCVNRYGKFNRPVICTEYMGRPHSLFQDNLPMFKANNIGAINFGLVKGKCCFHLPWGTLKEDAPEPKTWFHDIFHEDGTPYDPAETELIKKLTGKA